MKRQKEDNFEMNDGNILKKLFGKHPHLIGIETQSQCNLSCGYCPVSTHKKRADTMTYTMFYGIVETLKRAGYKGRIQMQGYCEPLMDARLEEFIRVIRRELPDCRLCLASNGTLFNPLRELSLEAAGLKRIHITHHDKPWLETAHRKVGDLCIIDDSLLGSKQSVRIENRCGSLEMQGKKWSRHVFCKDGHAPWIMASGDITMCCQDYNAIRNGYGLNVSNPDWFKEYSSLKNRILRFRTLFGPRPKSCWGCGHATYKK